MPDQTIRLTAMHSAQGGSPVLAAVGQIVSLACSEAEIDPDVNLSLTVVLTGTKEDGWEAVRALDAVDSLILFGQTAQSLGLDDMEMFERRTVMLQGQVQRTQVLRVPSLLSSRWQDTSTIALASRAITPLLRRAVEIPLDLVLTAPLWN